jgi:hypothetical protein
MISVLATIVLLGENEKIIDRLREEARQRRASGITDETSQKCPETCELFAIFEPDVFEREGGFVYESLDRPGTDVTVTSMFGSREAAEMWNTYVGEYQIERVGRLWKHTNVNHPLYDRFIENSRASLAKMKSHTKPLKEPRDGI